MGRKSGKKKKRKANKKIIRKDSMSKEINFPFNHEIGDPAVVGDGFLDPDPGMGDVKIQDNNKILLATMTKEPVQLARLYYDLSNKDKIQQIFSRLRCMDYDKSQDRWVWLYDGEARKLKFEASYFDIPKKRRPIVIGSFFSRTTEEIFLNVNSFERAQKAVLFFDKYIPRSVAKVTDIAVVNRLFDTVDGSLPKHEDFFDKQPIKKKDPEALMQMISGAVASIEDPLEKMKVTLSKLKEDAKKPLGEVERFPVHFYEDGISHLEGCLLMRQTIALNHWYGNKDYTSYDLMQKVISRT